MIYKEDFRQPGQPDTARSPAPSAINASEVPAAGEQAHACYTLKILEAKEPREEVEELGHHEVSGDLDVERAEVRMRMWRPGLLNASG